jgi:hypothetical protein
MQKKKCIKHQKYKIKLNNNIHPNIYNKFNVFPKKN